MPGDPPPSLPSLAWTATQRRVLLLLLTLLLVFLSLRYAFHPTYVGDPQPERAPRSDELADRIDPNTADWPALAALPGVGEKRAKDIVAYREETRRYSRNGIVFARREDMLRVKGIGVAMLEGISPYLEFPRPPSLPASVPAR